MGTKYVFNPTTGNLDATDVVAFNGEVDLGTAAAPSIFFTGDPNTGIYSPGADQVAISTNGTGRLFVNSAGAVDVYSANARLYISTTGTNTATATLRNANYFYNLNLVGSSGDLQLFNNSERLRITSDGKVGLGTSSPSTLLSLYAGASSEYFRGGGNGTTQRDLVISATTGANAGDTHTFNASGSTGQLILSTASTPRMLINSSGNVGIGTTSPSQRLQLSGNSSQYASIVSTDSGNTGVLFGDATKVDEGYVLYANSDNSLRFGANGGTERARIDSSGRFLVGTSTARQTGGGFTAQSQIEGATTVSASSLTITSNRSSDDLGPRLNFARSKGGAIGSNTIVDADAEYGGIYFFGADGSDTDSIGAQISAYVDGTPGANDMPGRLVFSTTADGASSPTERMRITSAGSSRQYADTTGLWVATGSAAGTTIKAFIVSHSATGVASGTESLRIFSNGNVENTNNSYGAISDIKLKENIVDANSQWDDLKALQVRNYNFKAGQTHTQIGLVAQEVELVSPGLVSESPDFDEEGNDLGTVTKSVNYSVLYMKAVKALQEAMERIETLEQRLNDAGIA